MSYQSINPNDGKDLKSYAERALIVNKAAALLRAHVDDFARLETLEMGKRISEAPGEVKFSADILSCYAQHAEAFLAPVRLNPKVGGAHIRTGHLAALA